MIARLARATITFYVLVAITIGCTVEALLYTPEEPT